MRLFILRNLITSTFIPILSNGRIGDFKEGYRMRFISLFLVIVLIVGCSYRKETVVGQTRSPIDPEKVEVYLIYFEHKEPSKYEVIGLVSVSSTGITQQGAKDSCIAELKKQAAKLGANGVLVYHPAETRMSSVSGYSRGFLWNFPIAEGWISGTAIFVRQENEKED